MTSDFETPTVEPAFAKWPDLLKSAAAGSGAADSGAGRVSARRMSARKRLVDSAEQFVLRLNGRAVEAGLPALQAPLLTADSTSAPIVMTGHQPVIFHSGLVYKYLLTEQFALQQRAICVAVVIDTDQGDCGQFVVPKWESATVTAADRGGELSSLDRSVPPLLPDVRLSTESLSAATGLYFEAPPRSGAEIRRIQVRTIEGLKRAGLMKAAGRAGDVLEQYARLSDHGLTMMEANLIMRWQYGIGASCLELPLSALAAFPEMLSLTVEVLLSAETFWSTYNGLLDQYRRENNIRNEANPFPSLDRADQTLELPFWVINHQRHQRQALFVRQFGQSLEIRTEDSLVTSLPMDEAEGVRMLERLLLEGIQVVPRGSLITAFLRLLFSDLFVHGTGGGKYDRFTELLMRSWWNVEPSPFAVASASRYLLSDARVELGRLDQLATQLRDMQFNPQRFFDTDIFSAGLRAELIRLNADKQSAVEELKAARRRGESAKSFGKKLQQLTDQIKDLVTAEFEPSLNRLNSLTPEAREAINCRTYPWFLFADS